MHRRFKTALIIRKFSGFTGGEGKYPLANSGGYCIVEERLQSYLGKRKYVELNNEKSPILNIISGICLG